MSQILDPDIKIVSVTKISSPEFEKENDGYGDCKVVAQVVFYLPIDLGEGETLKDIKRKALYKLEGALA